MPQLRQDPTTKEWVIIATEHVKRPHSFKKSGPKSERPFYKEDCPFCPGNEHLTPPETPAYRSGGPPNSKGWWVSVVPNKFPALSLEGSLERKEEKGFFRMMDGVGVHEVIIGSPIYNQLFPLMEDKEVGEVLLAYRERYLALRKDPRIKLIIIFKNHGEAAEHPWNTPIPRLLGRLSFHPISERNWRRQPVTTMTMEGVSIAIR